MTKFQQMTCRDLPLFALFIWDQKILVNKGKLVASNAIKAIPLAFGIDHVWRGIADKTEIFLPLDTQVICLTTEEYVSVIQGDSILLDLSKPNIVKICKDLGFELRSYKCDNDHIPTAIVITVRGSYESILLTITKPANFVSVAITNIYSAETYRGNLVDGLKRMLLNE